MLKAGLLFGVASVFAAIAALFVPIPLVNILVAFASIIALGWAAGYTAAKWTGAQPGQGVGRGAGAGAIAGGINLLLLTVMLIVLFSTITRLIPGIEEQFNEAIQQAQQETPGQEIPDVSPTGLLGIGGGVLGFCFGLVNLLIMTVSGLVGGVMWKGSAPTTAGGMSYPPGGMPGYMVGGQPPAGQVPPTSPYETQSLDNAAKIYPDDSQQR